MGQLGKKRSSSSARKRFGRAADLRRQLSHLHPETRLFSILIFSCLVFAPLLRAQDNPLNDPDLKEMLKEAQEMQKEAKQLQKDNPASQDTKKKLAEMLSQAKEEEVRQEEEEKREKEKLQAALKKQLEAPGPVVLPNWTPSTPEFKAAGAAARKIVDDEVKIVQTGASSLTPEKIADSWQAAAATANNLNQSLNKINVNGKITRILFLSTRTEPRQEVELEASREPDGKITQVEISSPLPKPNIESE
jgi:vacuolar-type H+-ATPase subunit I/STV1